MQRRQFIVSTPLVAAASLLASSPAARAQNPGTVRLVVPFPPGGATDIVARLIAPALAQELGQAVVVDNRAGAGGSLGMAEVARAAPDGLTLGMATMSTHGVNPVVYKKLPYDALRDFTPLAELTRAALVLVVNPKLPARTMAEFLGHARAHPGRLTYGTPGVGSVGHMATEQIKASTGIHLVHIPYRGAAGVMTDLMGGQIDVAVDQLASAQPHIQSGALRALAVSWPQRLAHLKDVPTFAEVGLAESNEPSWFGLVAPARLPEAAQARFAAALLKVMGLPEVKARCEQLGLQVVSPNAAEFRKVIAGTIERMRVVARRATISLD